MIVLNEDTDFEKRLEIDFQQKRLFVINQFSEGNIWLNYHLNALSKDEVKKSISFIKDEILLKFENELGLPNILLDENILDNKKRKEDYETRKYRFDNLNSFRFKRLIDSIGLEKTKEIKKELDKYKAIPSTIEIEGETPLLKIGKPENWNFLLEGKDFEMKLDGKITWKI